jgi:maltose O-acetyltransferase
MSPMSSTSETVATTHLGVAPLTEAQLRERRRAAICALPGEVRRAFAWLTRGGPATSPLVPLALRRALLRLGGVKLGAMIWGLERCWFESPDISVGAGSYVNAGCWFEGAGTILIGENCLLGPEVMILTSHHPIGSGGGISRGTEAREVRIEDGCWIGARAMVMPGVHIGAGAVIAAGAVVSKDCDSGGVYAGVPARRIR